MQSRTINYGCQDTLSGCQSGTGTSRSYTTTMKTTTSPQYTITDNAGNQAICGAKTVNVYVDRDAPTISFSLPSGNTFNEVKSLDITANDNNASGVNKIEYQVSFNGANRGSGTSNGNIVNGISLDESGKYIISARALDNAGNWSNWYTAEYEISLGLVYGPYDFHCEPNMKFYANPLGDEIEKDSSHQFEIGGLNLDAYKKVSITITTNELNKSKTCSSPSGSCIEGFTFYIVSFEQSEGYLIGKRNGTIASATVKNNNGVIEGPTYSGVTKGQTITIDYDLSNMNGPIIFGFRCYGAHIEHGTPFDGRFHIEKIVFTK